MKKKNERGYNQNLETKELVFVDKHLELCLLDKNSQFLAQVEDVVGRIPKSLKKKKKIEVF